MNVDREPDVVLMKFGSHLYGLNTPNSDVDYKGVFLNTMEELIIGEGPHNISRTTGQDDSKNGAGDEDFEIMSLHKFIKHAIQGETFAIDMLHCDEPISDSPIWQHLVENRTKFYSKDMKSFIGYVKSQAAKYGVKGSRLADIKSARWALCCYKPDVTIGEIQNDGNGRDGLYYGEYASWKEKHNPKSGQIDSYYVVNGKMYQSTNTVEYVVERLGLMYDGYGHRAKLAEKNEGIDWKAVSHALRAGYQALHIYEDGDFEFPLPETEFLKQVKAGELDYTTVVGPALEEVVEHVDLAASYSDLPQTVDTKYWKKWLTDYYKLQIKMELILEEEKFNANQESDL
jgi:hypothetical protein